MNYETAAQIFDQIIMKGSTEGVYQIEKWIKYANLRSAASTNKVTEIVGSYRNNFESLLRNSLLFLDDTDPDKIDWVIVQIATGFNAIEGVKDKETGEISHKIIERCNAKSWGADYPNNGDDDNYAGLLWVSCLIPLFTFHSLVQSGYGYRLGIKMGGNQKQDFIGAMMLGQDLDNEENLISVDETFDHYYHNDIGPVLIHYSPSGNEDHPKLRGIIALDSFEQDYEKLVKLAKLLNEALPNAAKNVFDPARGYNPTIIDLPHTYVGCHPNNLEDLTQSLGSRFQLPVETNEKGARSDSGLKQDVYRHFDRWVLSERFKGDFTAFHEAWCEHHGLYYENWGEGYEADNAEWTIRGACYDAEKDKESLSHKSNCLSRMLDGTLQVNDTRSGYEGDLIIDVGYQLEHEEPGARASTSQEYKTQIKLFFDHWCPNYPFEFVNPDQQSVQIDDDIAVDKTQGYFEALLKLIAECSSTSEKTGLSLIRYDSIKNKSGYTVEQGLIPIARSYLIIEAFFEWLNHHTKGTKAFYRIIETVEDHHLRSFLLYSNYRYKFLLLKNNDELLRSLFTAFSITVTSGYANGDRFREEYWSVFTAWIGSVSDNHHIDTIPDFEHRYIAVNNGVFDLYTNQLIPRGEVSSHFEGRRVNCRTYYNMTYDQSKVNPALLDKFISDFSINVIDSTKPLVKPMVTLTLCGLLGYLGVIWYTLGEGNTGKSTMIEIMLDAIGRGSVVRLADKNFEQVMKDEDFLRERLEHANVLHISEATPTKESTNFFKSVTGKLAEHRYLIIKKKFKDVRESRITFGAVIDSNEWVALTSEQRDENKRRDLLMRFKLSPEFKPNEHYKDFWTKERLESLLCTAMFTYEHSELIEIRAMMDGKESRYSEIYGSIRREIEDLSKGEDRKLIQGLFSPSYYRDEEVESCIDKDSYYQIMATMTEQEITDGNKKLWTSLAYSGLKNLGVSVRGTGSSKGNRDELQYHDLDSLVSVGLDQKVSVKKSFKVVYGLEPTQQTMEDFNLVKIKTRSGMPLFVIHSEKELMQRKQQLDSIYTEL